ncbi:MAG TPA: TIR domain-containing protein, partial [Steroidobacteraceae bacterium]|nr:TIR domain-containing protein [Steroidobacteraceae bacterium]
MSRRVFISYAHGDPDQQIARSLRARLEDDGHDVFLDDEIPPGAQWSDDIDGALATVEFFIVLLSARSVASDAVAAEVDSAHRRQLASELVIVPVRLDYMADLPSQLKFALHGLEYIAWTAGEPHERVVRKVAASVASQDARFLTWDELVAESRAHVDRFAREAAGVGLRRTPFNAELYVAPRDAEEQLARFLSSDSRGLVIVGDPGTGKTSLLCHWALRQSEAGNAVLLFNCGELADTDVLDAVSVALGSPRRYGARLRDGLESLARSQQRDCIIVFDALNDFCVGKASPRDLWDAIDRHLLAPLAAGARLRVVVSCNSSAWNLMTRRAPGIALDPSRYFAAGEGGGELRLRGFTDAELADAYVRYQKAYGLPPLEQLPRRVQKQLLNPLLLHMFAESGAGAGGATDRFALENDFIAAYLDRRAPRQAEQFFIEDLAALMYASQEQVLPVKVAAEDPKLAPELRDADPASSWSTLLASGVLGKERRGSPPDDVVRFAFPTVSSYLLARRLGRIKERAELRTTIQGLVSQAGRYPPAWDAARTLLGRAVPGSVAPEAERRQPRDVQAVSQQVLEDLAGSRDLEQREIVVATLAERHASDPAGAGRIMRRLLRSSSPEAQRVAIKTAYCIGSAAREVFVQAVESGGPALLEAVKDTLYLVWRNESPGSRASSADTLYLIWRRNPGFTRDFLRDVVARLGLLNVLVKLPLLRLFLQLSITIYINHCEQREVTEQTAELYRTLATSSLHLDTLNANPVLAKLIRRALVSAFSGPIFRSMFPPSLVSADAFFASSAEERAPLKHIAAWIDPATDLGAVRDELPKLLSSSNQIFALAAAVAISVHACRDFARTEPLVRELFGKLDVQGQLWLLFGFGVLLPDTPPAWRGLVEEMTRTICSAHRAQIISRQLPLLQVFDFLFVPLGLACGKSGERMSFVGELLTHALDTQDSSEPERAHTDPLVRWLEALTPVGFYYPQTVLDELREAMQETGYGIERWTHAARQALDKLLATMRTLHLDLVDQFAGELALE